MASIWSPDFAGLVINGVGDMVGAGIYTTISEIAGQAGHAAPCAFMLGAVLCGICLPSLRALAARYPHSAGVAHYTRCVFGHRRIARAIGLTNACMLVCITSCIATSFTRYAGEIVPSLNTTLLAHGVVILLATLNGVGFKMSTALTCLFMIIECGGILAVCLCGRRPIEKALSEHGLSYFLQVPSVEENTSIAKPIIAGALRTFFAYNGFQGLVHLTDDVPQAAALVPLAMTTCLTVAAALYAAVTASCVTLVSPSELASADGAPLALVLAATGPAWSHSAIALVGMCSGFNSALVVFGEATGLISGLAEDGLLPEAFLRNRDARAHAAICAVLITCMLVIQLQTWQNMSETASHQMLWLLIVCNATHAWDELQNVPAVRWFSVLPSIFGAALVLIIFVAGQPSEAALKLTVAVEAVIIGSSCLFQ